MSNQIIKIKNFYKRTAILLLIFLGFTTISFCTKPPKLEPGIYVNYELNFTIEFPKDWIAGEKIPGENLYLMSPNQSPNLVLSVYRKDAVLKNAPEEWMNLTKMLIPSSGQYKVLSREIISLNDGTTAMKAKISWAIQNINLMTSFLAVDKNNKRIVFQCTGTKNIPFKVMEGITDSFRFN